MEKVLGPEHRETLINFKHLASNFEEQDKDEEAGGLYRRAVEGA